MKTEYRISFLGAIALAATLAFNAATPDKTPNPDEWPAFGYDATNSKFSPLDKINQKNVSQLKPIWHYEETQEGGTTVFWNPLVVKGRLFAFMPSQKLVALEPASGKVLWEFRPDSTDVATWTRGLTYHAGTKGRPDALLFVYGSTLYSIDATSGKLVSYFGKKGKVDFYEGMSVAPSMRSKVHVTANAPGVIFNDLYIVGCKVPDELPATSGDIRAFDANTGKLVWTFHTIPKRGEYGADTWPEGARDRNGGANCWGGMALDYERGIVYAPTASPSFDFYGADRPGQNLFANCLLALDARTGKRLWHFQTTHHDLWDRDNGSPPNLLTVNHDSQKIDAVALATKMGYVFLFNRETGEPLFPHRGSTRADHQRNARRKALAHAALPDQARPLFAAGFPAGNISARWTPPLRSTSRMILKKTATRPEFTNRPTCAAPSSSRRPTAGPTGAAGR